MKKLFLTLLFFCSLLVAKAQTEHNATVTKFIGFYKANQADSIFGLFSPEMKAALKIEGTRQMLTQLKGQLGEIVKSGYNGSPANTFNEYRLSFEKPIVEMALIVKDNLIAGIHQKQVKAAVNDPVELESKDNFSINNTIGTLYGTLLLPQHTGKVPVVLMIGGSGPTDRNMNQGQALKSNSFLMLAKALAAQGIATLRYDKRGVGKSSAAHQSPQIALDDFINDAQLLITKLQADDRFSKVIVLGHSEGAIIGLVSSLKTTPTAFISLSGYATNMADILKKQLKTLASPEDYKTTTEIIDSLKGGKIVNRKLPSSLADLFSPATQAYLRSTLKYDASKEMSKMKIPVLVIGGTTDLQVGIEEAKQLAKANPKATLKLVEGMNHVLKAAPVDRTLNLETYNSPEKPIHDALAPLLVDFINRAPATL
ncbi:alpha/beta fold hydrolase [Pedobacter sp.]|uniref:alpha/beta hydrolase n=1 Tax=Pedobacter sp. TaxID=1411316 RepID=UPI003D7F6BD2